MRQSAAAQAIVEHARAADLFAVPAQPPPTPWPDLCATIELGLDSGVSCGTSGASSIIHVSRQGRVLSSPVTSELPVGDCRPFPRNPPGRLASAMVLSVGATDERDRPLPVAGLKGTPEEIERHWYEQVYRGRGDSMAQLTWRAVLIGSCLGSVLSLTNL